MLDPNKKNRSGDEHYTTEEAAEIVCNEVKSYTVDTHILMPFCSADSPLYYVAKDVFSDALSVTFIDGFCTDQELANYEYINDNPLMFDNPPFSSMSRMVKTLYYGDLTIPKMDFILFGNALCFASAVKDMNIGGIFCRELKYTSGKPVNTVLLSNLFPDYRAVTSRNKNIVIDEKRVLSSSEIANRVYDRGFVYPLKKRYDRKPFGGGYKFNFTSNDKVVDNYQ